MVYAFLKVKTVTCRHETFITSFGGPFVNKCLSCRSGSSTSAVKQGFWRKKCWGEEIKRKSSLLNVLSAPRSCCAPPVLKVEFFTISFGRTHLGLVTQKIEMGLSSRHKHPDLHACKQMFIYELWIWFCCSHIDVHYSFRSRKLL